MECLRAAVATPREPYVGIGHPRNIFYSLLAPPANLQVVRRSALLYARYNYPVDDPLRVVPLPHHRRRFPTAALHTPQTRRNVFDGATSSHPPRRPGARALSHGRDLVIFCPRIDRCWDAVLGPHRGDQAGED